MTHADSVHFFPVSTTVYKRYQWTFGDGTGSDLRNPWHHYAAPGVYYVCLTVRDTTSGGTCVDTWCDSVYVVTPAPPVCNAHFAHYSLTGSPDSVHFYPQTNSTHAHYHWTFGDNTSSTNHDPWHLYQSPGTYIVCLTVTDTTSAGTCIDVQCDTLIIPVHITVYPNPVTNMVSIAVPHGNRTVGIEIRDGKGVIVYRGETDTPGSLSVRTDGMGSGVYFYQLFEGGNVVSTGKFIVVKSSSR
jgi:PKD repeat protein